MVYGSNSNIVRWECPNCGATDITGPGVPNRWHTCPGLHGLTAPLVREGTDCKVEAVERDDVLGKEIQRHGDDGKPYMSVITTRRDGNDVAVNAGLARGSLGDAWDVGIGLLGPSDE